MEWHPHTTTPSPGSRPIIPGENDPLGSQEIINKAIDLLTDNGYVVIDNNRARASWGGHTETARATEGVSDDE